MNDATLQTTAVEAIMAINAAVRTLRLYPPGSAMITTSLEKVARTVDRLLAQTAEAVFAEAEKKLLICDQPVSEKEMQKPQLRAFLDLLLDLGVRSLVLRRGVDHRQLKALLLLLRRKPEEVEAGGGLRRMAEPLELTHIEIDEKHYVALDEGQRVVTDERVPAAGPAATGENGASAEPEQTAGRNHGTGLEAPGAEPRSAEQQQQRSRRIAQMRQSVEQILRGARRPFSDDAVVQALPGAIAQLVTRGKQQTFDELMTQVGQAMDAPEAAVRSNAGQVLIRVLERLPEAPRAQIVQRLLPQIVERAADAAAGVGDSARLLAQLEAVANDHLHRGQTAAGHRIIEALKKASDTPDATAAIRDLVARMGETAARSSSPAATDAATAAQTPATDLTAGEAEVDRLAAAGDTAAAVARLLTLVGTAAAARQFETAERLRERFYDIDAMALAQIIEAGEIIETAKGGSVDSDHLEIFADLYNRLDESARNSLYLGTQPADIPMDETLVHQGDANDHLFFINDGQVRIVYQSERGEALLDRLAGGSLVGAESFFKATVATVSAVSLSPLKAVFLTRSALSRIDREHPGLAATLQDWALGRDNTATLLRQKGMDRRTQKRFKVTGRTRAQLLDRTGQPSGRPFSGQLADFSIGGISFFIKSAKPETARLLLGRRLELRFALPGSPAELTPLGTVIGVNYLLETDYSLHVRFDRPMDPAIAAALESGSPSENG